MTRILLTAACLLVAASRALGAAPTLDDYAQGMSIAAPTGFPLIEATLPDPVYQAVSRDDLGDVRVFNAEGTPVPHAFCSAPAVEDPAITQQELPVFQLREASGDADAGSRVEIQTPGGTHVNVLEAGRDAQPVANGRVHIIDARASDDPIRAIQFEWQSADEASQVQVSIEASGDLDRWRVVVPRSALLRAIHGAQELKRERIELPPQPYRYLRVQRTDGGPPLAINRVTAERVGVAEEIDPTWFMATVMASNGSEGVEFDTARRAPIRYARLRLPQDNSSVEVALQSRNDPKAVWTARWSGEVYRIVTDTQRRESPPARLDVSTDRYWRVQFAKDAELYRDSTLELGYRPARLRFLAQGSGPFTLAFGSRRVAASPATGCDSLLADVAPDERKRLVAEGTVTTQRALGGESAMQPLPRQTPVRLVVLWSVLIGGVGLLVAMALTLLKRVGRL